MSSAAKVWLEIQWADHVEKRVLKPLDTHAESDKPCPGCKASPLRVRGTSPITLPDNRTIRSGGVTMCCGDNVGYIFARPDTLFGLEEDRRVLNGRARVY